ncbi:uncharacterized protein LOC121420944 [Lytechinus variegatus]|uniref:uncharacterized protein LOC121420944 n=1 Tax=Lytechinus variegatus TaxID=7654 RepID=UPI001BB2C1C3|nr:uncharacterized protein LOC121420944 [Lytechinus variegatus]
MYILFYFVDWTPAQYRTYKMTMYIQRWVAIHVSVIVLFSCQAGCDGEIQHIDAIEGKRADMDFPYPCDSTRITLQNGNSMPFFNSGNSSLVFPRNYIITNNNDTTRCSLHLAISPVTRDDRGGYIMTPYKNGNQQPDVKIYLNVDFSHGKAWCSSSTISIGGEWIKLSCTASADAIPRQISCWQDGMRLPKLEPTDENKGGQLLQHQDIFARVSGPVHCCSHGIDRNQTRCECKDCAWDPLQNGPMYDIPEPCPQSTQPLPSTPDVMNPRTTEAHSNSTSNLDCKTGHLWYTTSTIFLIISLFINIAQWKQRSVLKAQLKTILQRQPSPEKESETPLQDIENTT